MEYGEIPEPKEEYEKKVEQLAEKHTSPPSPIAAILSLLASIGVGLCWLFRDFEFRHALTTGEKGKNWLMIDINMFLRRLLLILTVIAIWLGLKAVLKRGKPLDIIAFVISLIIALFVGIAVHKMGGRGFWLN